ncbi:MAG: STT3 domain-containing protein [Candidatus Thalassarchaeaceae archaeon]|nr:STT3 domain-containing protein [Candidatus Thalassarchaeaceae archaeon]
MDNENGTTSTKAPYFGLLAIPATIAIMLAMMVAATWNAVDYEASDWNILLMITAVLTAGGLLGKAPRIIFEPVGTRPSLVSLGFAVVIGAVGMVHYYDGAALLGLAFTMIAIGVHLFDRSRRHEEELIVVGLVAGFVYAIQVASAGHGWGQDGALAGQYYDIIDIDRLVTGYLFFTWWIISILSSVIIALALRGRLQDGGHGSWFKEMPDVLGKEHTALYSGLGVWLAAHVFSLWHLTTIDNPDAIYLAEHVGFFWAFFTGIVAMFVAFCWAEHWRTLGLFIGLNWILYTLGNWQDAGLFAIGKDTGFFSFLHGGLGTLSWFAIFFWVNAVVVYVGFSGRLMRGPERRGPGQARLWWGRHWYAISVGGALLSALVVRVMWNVIPAMNAAGTGEWDMTGGSDPWYMKRAIDYILAQNSHFVIDMDRAYPVGSINPRPPLFSWSLVLGGIAVDPFIEGDVHEAAWWSIAGMPAIYGALTVLPIAATCKRFFGTGAGVLGAWLMALMPGHVSHSTFGLADHDAFVIFFMSLGFYFWLSAVDKIGSDKLLDTAEWNPVHMITGIREAFKKHPVAMSQAILAGVSFATVALGWKGFVYGLAIVYAAYFLQTALNLIRRRDSMPVTSAIVVMMLTTFILPLPFYGNAQLNLIWDASGFQPLFYILGFTIINGWVVTSFRDKPWLMVVIMGSGITTALLGTLYVLQLLDISNGWDVLTTGGFYFSKNKVFGTIAEAQAPSRGQLFANFGPLVFIFALGMGIISLLRGFRNRDPKQPHILMGPASLVLAVWILLASYMAWSAGRFMFNATPVMAIMGSAAISGLWRSSGVKEYRKTWRRMGIGGAQARFSSTIRSGRKHPGVPAIGLVLILLFSQHAVYGLDSGIPRGEVGEKQVDDVIHDIFPDALRAEIFGWSVFDGSPYKDYGIDSDNDEMVGCRGATGNECWYMGTFGPGFNGRSWNQAYDWLENQDADVTFSERPAFVSWWDYGFQALAQGQHPTVADNFQSGIPAAGNMLLADGEDDTIALFIVTLAEGDMRHEYNLDKGDADSDQFTRAFMLAMQNHFKSATQSDSTWDEWVDINTMSDRQDVRDRSFTVIGSADDTVLTEGIPMNADGTRTSESKVYRLYENREFLAEYTDKGAAIADFDQNSKVDWIESCPSEGKSSIDVKTKPGENLYPGDATYNVENAFSCKASHYIIGDYWYTSDLYDDFNDVSTSLHRQNARYAIARDLLTHVFSLDELVDLYHDLTSVEYEVATYEGGPGETVVRNNDIRYFAVDNRLYPIGGLQYAESNMHYQNPTGIFYAPTTLSGLDPENYIDSIYVTNEGPMTPQAFETRYMADLIAGQSGGTGEIIELEDVLVEQQPDFFETMIARTYVGYGTPQLGLANSQIQSLQPLNVDRPGQPKQHFTGYGTPDTPLTFAYPLPGAMMNHFVLANWYEPNEDNPENIAYANTGVKVLKYYSGATLEGDIVLGEIGAVPNAKLLIERDAFSGEDPSDTDARTYWIPIGTAQADDEGHFSIRVPSGKIRVSAFMGESDLVAARDGITQAGGQEAQNWAQDLVTEINDDRIVNPITGILGNVSGSTWIGEAMINVTGEEGHSNGESVLNMQIQISASGATGTIEWQGDADFGGVPLANMDLRISNIWDDTRQDAYYITTSDGEVDGEREFGPGALGEVTFTGPGSMITEEGAATVTDFTGNYTRSILHNHSYDGAGNILGRGTFVGTIADADPQGCVNGSMPDLATYCLEDVNVTNTFLIDGFVEGADGRFTANGTAFFTTPMYRETIIGSGTFIVDASDTSLSSYGTINGTGTFQGTGHFSGDMVKPGSFHLVDAIPGTYHVAVLFENGKESILPTPLIVPLSRDGPDAKNIELSLPGTWIQGTASMLSMTEAEGDIVTGRLKLVEFADMEANVTEPCGDIAWAPCWFDTDDNGTFGIGPVLEGEYVVTMDQDSDGFDEYRSDTITVQPDNAGNVTPSDIDRIPPMYDIEFLLLDHQDQPVEGQNLTFSNQFTPITIDARDNGNGSYNIELPRDTWVVESILDEEYILYEEIDLQEDITGLVLQYVESAWVNGTVLRDMSDKVDEPDIPFSNQMVNIQWGGISETTMTDENGTFGFQIPVGAEVNMTVHVVINNLLAGEHFTVASGGNQFTLYPQNSVGAAGDLFLYDVGNAYTQSVPGFGDYPFMMEAHDNSTGVTWQWPVDTAQGRFTAYVLEGADNETRNWTLSINNDALNVTPFTYSPLGDNNTLYLVAEPDYVIATLSTFIDHTNDGNMSNGTSVPIDFRLLPTNAFDDSLIINVSADQICEGNTTMNCWENGSIELELRVGNWIFETDAKDARSENATDFNTILSNSSGLVEIAIGADPKDVELGFMPEWRTSITLENQLAAPMANWTVYFEEIDGDDSFNLDTDENGTIVDYLPEGEWLAYVLDFIDDDGDDTNDDPLQTFRGTLTVDSSTPGTSISWQTVEAAQFNLTLIETGSGELLSGYSITAVSEDGLGEFTLGPSDENGIIDAALMEGAWTLSMNRTDSNVRWILNDVTINVAAGSGNADTNLSLDKWVEIAGNLFRDINEDDAWSYAEGIEGANVTVNSTTFGPVELVSDVLGTWRVFVPVNSTYDVFAIKDGYSNGSTSIEVGYVVNTSDIEMTAGIVSVGGEISHVLPSEWNLISDDISLALLPESGLSFSVVTPTKVLDNGQWDGTWEADVDPGNWILYATYDGDEGQFAAMTLVEAAVADGGQADAMLSTASLLHVSTKWVDFDGVNRTLADDSLINSGNNLVFSSDSLINWNQTVDSNGQLSLLLPAGDYSMSGTFETTEHGVNMTYNGGKSANVVGGGVESPEQLIEFRVQEDHSITFSVGSNHTSIVQSSEDGDNFTIVDDGDELEYAVGEINLQMTYSGNRVQDDYTFGIQLNGGDAQFWTVEVWTGVDENGTDIWEPDQYEPQFSLGLETNNTVDIRLRVTPANKTVAESYDGGHSLLLTMTEDGTGSYDEYELKLFVPQVYGVEVDQDQIADVIGVQIGQEEPYSFWFNNTGNGDDTFTISISDLPEQLTPLWSVTGATTLEVGPRSTQGYSVTIHASELWVGDVEEFPVTVTITSEDGNTTESVILNIKTALPDLEFVDHGAHGLSMDGFAPMGQSMEFFANVKNTGDVNARDVEVIVLDNNGTIVGSLTKDVPMDETTEFIIEIAAVEELGSITYTFKINSTAGEMEDTPGVEVLKLNYQPTVATESNDWVALIVVVFVAGILGLFWKFSGRRGSQAF